MCVVHPRCPFVVVLSSRWICHDCTLFNSSCASLKSTWVYVMMSLPWRRSSESVGLLALLRISEIASDNTSNILVPKQITVRDRMIRANLALLMAYPLTHSPVGVHHVGAIVPNYYCNTAVYRLLRVHDARPLHSIRVELYSSISTGCSTTVRTWYSGSKM